MKKNNLRKTSTWFATVMIFFMFFLINGCQQEKFSDIEDIMPYLSISSDNPFKNSKDLETLSMALNRINLIRENGFLKIKQSSAREINVSDGLYKLLEDAVNHTNKLAISKAPKWSPPRLKSGGEDDPDYEDSYTDTDCVAHAIAACSDYSFEYIDGWIREQPEFYVNGVFQGVRLDHFERVCKQFMPGDLVSADEIVGDNSNAIVVFDMGEGNFHAVNSVNFNDEFEAFSYLDYQNPNEDDNPSYGIASYENI